MTDQPIGWLAGIVARTKAAPPEAEARLNMAQVINLGSRASRLEEKPKHLGCPWCGQLPLLPANVCGRYVIECENDECIASVSVAGDTPADAIAKWNRRA